MPTQLRVIMQVCNEKKIKRNNKKEIKVSQPRIKIVRIKILQKRRNKRKSKPKEQENDNYRDLSLSRT